MIRWNEDWASYEECGCLVPSKHFKEFECWFR